MTDKWNSPGSRWWKFDFHTHTSKSDDYGRGDASFKGIEPEAWLRKAMESGLDCVMVTDHNSGGWIDMLKARNRELRDCDAKPDWYRELTIFPGVEITVANSCSVSALKQTYFPRIKTCQRLSPTGATAGEEHGNKQIRAIT